MRETAQPKFRLSVLLRVELTAAAKIGTPNEICGFIDERDRTWPIQNCAAQPELYFAMEPSQVLAVHKAAWPARIVAVYHSHPNGPLDWSKRDRRYLPPNIASVLVARTGDEWHFLVHRN